MRNAAGYCTLALLAVVACAAPGDVPQRSVQIPSVPKDVTLTAEGLLPTKLPGIAGMDTLSLLSTPPVFALPASPSVLTGLSKPPTLLTMHKPAPAGNEDIPDPSELSVSLTRTAVEALENRSLPKPKSRVAEMLQSIAKRLKEDLEGF